MCWLVAYFAGRVCLCVFVCVCFDQTELDGYIAAECPLCGDIMVQSVDKPLIKPEEHEEQARQWAL